MPNSWGIRSIFDLDFCVELNSELFMHRTFAATQVTSDCLLFCGHVVSDLVVVVTQVAVGSALLELGFL